MVSKFDMVSSIIFACFAGVLQCRKHCLESKALFVTGCSAVERTFCNEMLSRRSGLRSTFGSFAFHNPPSRLASFFKKASACFRESCIPDSVRCLGEACLARAHNINNNFSWRTICPRLHFHFLLKKEEIIELLLRPRTAAVRLRVFQFLYSKTCSDSFAACVRRIYVLATRR